VRTIDIAVVVIYLAAVVAVGIACRGRSRSVDEYFTAHGLFRGPLGTLLVGLSIAATFFSGISLVVYISSAYTNGIQIGAGMLSMPVAWAVLYYWFLPRYLAGQWRHPYDIIERKFGRPVRLTLSAMFGLMRVGWMGVLVYAPALVIMGTANLGPGWLWPIVAVIGLSSTAYTVVGGIRGVIVTDAIQFLVIAGGMMFIGVFLFAKLDLSPALMWRELEAAGRLQWLNFSLDPTVTFTFWAVIFGLGVSNIGSYLADQMALQRYLASESPRAAIRSFTINIVSAIIIVMTLIVIGLLLWLWYRHHPDPAAPTQPDRIVSYFIAKELPVGVSGILIAAILAATMSSMTSGINGLAGTITNDWVARLGRERTPAALFKIGRLASLVIGVLATITAGFVDRMGTILQGSQVILGLFLGPMLACMVLATLETPIRPGAMLAGLVSGVGIGLLVVLSPASGLWVSPVGFATSFMVPWIFGRRIHQP
jgi:Na+/proline symporter